MNSFKELKFKNVFQGVLGLGFAIVEEVRDTRQGIYIRSITPGGVAAQVIYMLFYHIETY